MSLKVLIIYLMAWSLFSAHAIAADTANILVLNSNQSVKKYALAEDSFHPSKGKIIGRIDLAKLKNVNDEVRALLSKHSDAMVYCIGSHACSLANEYRKNQKIFFSSTLTWHEATNYSYGVSAELPADSVLTTYRFFFPKINKLGVVYSDQVASVLLDNIKNKASELGMIVIAKKLENPAMLTSTLNQLLNEVDALWLMPDPGVIADKNSVQTYFQLSDRMHKPVLAYNAVFIHYGAALSIAPDTTTIGKQVASMVDRVISQPNLGSFSEPPAASNISLNLIQSQKLKLEVRDMAIPTAQEIIE